MMYSFMRLDDQTEIVHSHRLKDGSVKVYFEKPIDGGFQSAACYLPDFRWEAISGFDESDIQRFRALLESLAHQIM